ncbi:MAG: oxidoreductase, partial [Nitrospirota bacterium]|nr:oxidoreductase [Nitrospirota bacterium]
TWVNAELEPPLSPYTWVIWNYDWAVPKKGKQMVSVRAIDVKGKVQTSEVARPQPSGATGLHSIVLSVESV